MTRMTLIEGGCSSFAVEIFSLVKSGNSKALAALLQSKAPPLEELNMPDKNERTCLSYAAANGDASMVDLLLATDIPDARIPDTEGNTPLIYAVSLGHSTVASKLLKYDTTIIDQANKNGFTALIKAAIHGRRACVELLIKAGADAELTDKTRDLNAFQWAKLCGSQSCIKSLKKHSQTKTKKSVMEKSSSDHHTPTSRIKKLCDSLTHNKHSTKEHLGIESIVACATTPTIPILMANAGSSATIVQIPVRLPSVHIDSGHHDKRSAKPTTTTHIIPPKIQITTDTGENITPNKHFYTATAPIRKPVK